MMIRVITQDRKHNGFMCSYLVKGKEVEVFFIFGDAKELDCSVLWSDFYL